MFLKVFNVSIPSEGMNQRVLLVLTLLTTLIALMSLDGRLIMSANASLTTVPGERFCFQTGPDPFEDARCFKGPANCQKAEDEFIANGGTVFGPCHHAFKHVKP
jgi:hypothetical protein